MYDFERFIYKDGDGAQAEKMWDDKSAGFYERTEKIQKKFANEFVFKLIKERRILNTDSEVLDIGCGTGRHLLEFSKYTQHLTGIDISSKMLSYAKEKLAHIPQARLVHGSWLKTFTREKEFDFVFACMTPAISSAEHLKRMSMISKKCMLERFVYQKDDIQEEIEQLIGRKLFNLPHNDKDYVYGAWNILWHSDYLPQVFFDTRENTETHTVEDYTCGIKCTDEEKAAIVNLVAAKAVNGAVTATERVIKAVVLWET